MRFIPALKIFFALVFGGYVLRGAFVPQSAWLLDGTNLLFHEAGHPLFFIFGQTIGIAGGTLMQLLIPAGIAIAFFYRRQFYSASMMLLWFGQNFFGISVYIRDARAQLLPLIGGDEHDWNYLLSKAGLLQQDQLVGGVVWIIGFIIVATALIISVYHAWNAPQKEPTV